MKPPTLPLLLAALSLAGSGPCFCRAVRLPRRHRRVEPKPPGKYAPNVYADDFIGPLMPGACHVSECVKKGIDPLSGKPMTAVPPESATDARPGIRHRKCLRVSTERPCRHARQQQDDQLRLQRDDHDLQRGMPHPPLKCSKPEDVTDPDFPSGAKAQKRTLPPRRPTTKPQSMPIRRCGARKRKIRRPDPKRPGLQHDEFRRGSPPPAKTDSNGINPDGNLEGAPAVPLRPNPTPWPEISKITIPTRPTPATATHPSILPPWPRERRRCARPGAQSSGNPNNVDNFPGLRLRDGARGRHRDSNKATGQLACAASLPPAGAPVNGMWDSFPASSSAARAPSRSRRSIAPCYQQHSWAAAQWPVLHRLGP